MGQSIDEAHAGRFITYEHYDLFIELLKRSMIDNGIPESSPVYSKFVDALMMVKNLIVQDVE